MFVVDFFSMKELLEKHLVISQAKGVGPSRLTS